MLAIVTGASTDVGRRATQALVSHGFAVVVVYLDDQPRAEEAVEEILSAGGTAVAVRADLADDLDVERLFTEAIAMFGVVDVVVDTTAGEITPALAHQVRERGATIIEFAASLEIGGADGAAARLISILDGRPR
jgi:3-oxoacyl-[acyl-carrier protein] reductase